MKVESFQDRYYTKVYIDDIKVSDLKDDTLSYYHSLYNTSFPLKSVFYTNIDLEKDSPLTVKIEFDQISLFQGRKFVGRLDYNVSNLLILLNEYYNQNFKIKIENIRKTGNHNIVDILIKRDYNFECYDYTETSIFRKIKGFLIGNMEYDSYTKKLLSVFFKQNKNLMIKTEKSSQNILNNFLLTTGIYYMKQTGRKSKIIIKNVKNSPYDNPFIKTYFDIMPKYKSDADCPFAFFCDEQAEFEKYIGEENSETRFCYASNDVSEKNFVEKSEQILSAEMIEDVEELPENIVLLNSLKKSELKDLKNIFVEYVPLKEKIRLKKLFRDGETIYSDETVKEIL